MVFNKLNLLTSLENLNFQFTDFMSKYSYTLQNREKGFLSSFQRIQDERLSNAEGFPNNPKIPEGISLSQEFFYLFEVFHIDEMGEVRKGIQRLFKNSSSATNVEKPESFINNMETHAPYAWATLGTISREKSLLPFASTVYSDRLPIFVKQISGFIVKLTPSFVGLMFEVSLNQQYNTRQMEIQSELLLPKVKIEKIHIARRSLTYSIHSSTNAKLDELSKFRKDVELATQKFLQKYFSGFFSRLKVGSPIMPAIEVFKIRGRDSGEKAHSDGQQPPDWLTPFGLLIGYPIFADDGLYFKSSIRNDDRTRYITDYLLINYDEYHSSATSDMEHILRDSYPNYLVTTNIAPLFIIKEILLRTKIKILKNRQLFPASTDNLIKEPISLKKKQNRFLQLIGTLTTINQLKVEFERWFSDPKLFWNEKKFLNEAKLLRPSDVNNDNYTLSQHFHSIIRNSFEEINSFLKINKSILKTIIEIENIKKTTSLAIVAIIVALISLVTSNNMFVQAVIEYIKKLLDWAQQFSR